MCRLAFCQFLCDETDWDFPGPLLGIWQKPSSVAGPSACVHRPGVAFICYTYFFRCILAKGLAGWHGRRLLLEKINSLTRNSDFRRAYTKGKSVVTPLVVVYLTRNRVKARRVGITTSKKIGNAVQRNRARRVIREAYRGLAPRVKRGFDLVLVARGRTPFVKSTDVERALEKALAQAGALTSGAGPL